MQTARSFRNLTHALSLTVLGAALVFAGCSKSDSPVKTSRPGGTPGRGFADQSAAIPVEIAIVRRDTISNYLLANTTLEPERSVDVVAKVSGVVVELRAEEGDAVKAGQLLARLDDSELAVNVKQAKARLDNAKTAFERAKEMFQKNLTSREAYEQAKLELETAQAQYESAQLQWQYSRIRAPIDGVVTVRNIDLGDMVNMNTVVFSLADFNPLLARVHVPEKDIAQVHVGQPAKITVESAPGRTFVGRVQMISPVVDPTTGTVKVTIEIRKREGILRPGMFASVYLVTETHPNALVIPKKALVLESERDMVFAFKNGRAHEVPLKLGFSDAQNVEVLAGLAEGDTVITVGQEGLREGTPVRVAQTAPIAGTETPARAESLRTSPRTPQRPTVAEGASFGAGQRRQITPEILKRMEERLLAVPEIRKAYEKKMKEPEFADDLEARARFLRKQARAYWMKKRPAGSGRPGF